MRVQEMFYLVNHALKDWVDPKFTERKSEGRVVAYNCINAAQLVSFLEPLRPFPEIRQQIDIIYSTHDTFYKGVVGAFTPQEKDKIVASMKKIKSSLLTMQSMCEALGLESESSGFDIKLPPNVTLSELAECTKDLNIIFTQCPLLCNDDEQVKLRGVDVGSMWLTFTIVCAGAATAFYVINNLAAIVSKIKAIREQTAICKQQEELARQAKLKNDTIQTIVESNNAIIKNLTQNIAEDLAAENGITSPESIEHIRGTLDMLKGWIDKGMEVYAAIEAPTEIKAVFPSPEAQALPSFVTKKLEAHETADE